MKGKTVTNIAQALAFGPNKLTDEGLRNYLAAVQDALAADIRYSRNARTNRHRVEAAKLAIQMRSEKIAS